MIMINKNKKSIISLNTKIEKCTICNRLVDFRTSIAKIKRKMYRKENYWGKPIAGFGDKNAKLMILGLAPAAHGGNRTGRVFTGDKSSDFLFMCLHAAGISNHSYSNNREDGLELFNTYLTLALKCVPPGDKPTREELHNCSYFLKNEMDIINLNDVAKRISPFLKKGMVLIFESSVAIGTTKQISETIESLTNLKFGNDLGLAYCPERYNPTPMKKQTQDTEFNIHSRGENFTVDKISRVVGGINEKSTEIAQLFYSQFQDNHFAKPT